MVVLLPITNQQKSSSLFTRAGTCDSQLFPKVMMTRKRKRFESIQNTEAARTTQVKTLEREDSRAAAGNGKVD